MTKEKEIELKVKADKISDEHLASLKGLVNSINTLQFNIGKLEATKHGALHNLTIAQDRVSVFQDVLTNEYGTFDVNIADGTINWPEDEK